MGQQGHANHHICYTKAHGNYKTLNLVNLYLVQVHLCEAEGTDTQSMTEP